MTRKNIHWFLIGLLISAGVFSTDSQAFNLGKELKKAAKEKIEEVKGGGEAAPVATPTESPAAANVSATPADTNKPSDTAKQEFNWKSPSQEEEVALGREITGSILGAAPLMKDEALQKYVNQVGRWIAN